MPVGIYQLKALFGVGYTYPFTGAGLIFIENGVLAKEPQLTTLAVTLIMITEVL